MSGAARPLVPRAGSGTGLLLAVVALALVSAWPERGDVANTSWYPLASVRASGLALWAWVLGALDPRDGGGPWRDGLARLALGAAATAPIEAFAHAASAPIHPLAWGLIAPLALAWAAFGVARSLATLVRRVRLGALLAPILVAAAAGAVALDLRVGLGWWTPWTLPRTPSLAAGVFLALAAAASAYAALRETRRAGPDASAGDADERGASP